jgi:hypothetical protein
MSIKKDEGGEDKKIVMQALLIVGLLLFVSQIMHDVKPGIDPVLRHDNDKREQRKIIKKLIE